MKKYIGTKEVKATPAWRIDGKIYPKDGVVPRVMNREDGYKVVYEDGYESWSPKDVFEKAYRVAETHEDRMSIELENLGELILKLNSFLATDQFQSLDKFSQGLLQTQYRVMRDYYAVLHNRLTGGMANGIYRINFGAAVEMIKSGLVVTRYCWEKEGWVVFRQVPSQMGKTIIPNMKSLPEQAKDFIMQHHKCICYTDQCLMYNVHSSEAVSWSPSIVDVFANDWEVVL